MHKNDVQTTYGQLSDMKPYCPAEIPESPGLYCFRFCLADPRTMGLIGPSDLRPKDFMEGLRTRIGNKLSMADKVLASRSFYGVLSEEKKSVPSMALELSARQVLALNFDEIKKDLVSIDSPDVLVNILAHVSLVLPPIYVGITRGQTLKARYNQHFYNYENNVPGTFGARLKLANVSWDDMTFHAIELPTAIVDKSTIKLCEDLLLSFSKPVLSYA